MTMNERVKVLRKELNLTLEKFGEQISMKKNSLSQIESGKNNLTERNIMLICETFNVNERWLRTGQGEMFREQSEEEEIASYLGKLLSGSNVNADFQKRFIRALSRLNLEDWEVIEKFCDMLMEEKKGQE